MAFSRGVPAPPCEFSQGGAFSAGSGAASCAERKFCRKKVCFFPTERRNAARQYQMGDSCRVFSKKFFPENTKQFCIYEDMGIYYIYYP